MATARANKKLQLALALCLAAVFVSAAATRTEPPETCDAQAKVDSCFEQIQEFFHKGNLKDGKVFTKECCNQLRDKLGCACVLRKKILKVGIDIQEPFCVEGSGCK